MKNPFGDKDLGKQKIPKRLRWEESHICGFLKSKKGEKAHKLHSLLGN